MLSADAIARVTGLSTFYASGTGAVENFSHCVVTKSAESSERVRLEIELDDPAVPSVQELENAKAADKGVSLPGELGPGYSAILKDADGRPSGAYVSAWTSDGTKTLSIRLYQGAPGRDHQADVVEFVRQLRPVLLDPKT
ncbi:hypothetical protein [Nonomuraea ceibae]|uniref:hypothetical protein n=1 Tax=Nonomuraea ceibae TaxID=1935170 RepID=UPI001C5E2DD0|nr:hypothetical protein [Nonomuraea ceibae]